MADREGDLKEMLKRFKNFLKEAELELSMEKTKIERKDQRFRKKEGTKRRQRKWKWGEQELEEVNEIRYLGYIVQKNGSDEKHIQERATIAMKKTWRKDIQTGLQEENEDVWSTGREHGAVWSRGMGLEHGRKTG